MKITRFSNKKRTNEVMQLLTLSSALLILKQHIYIFLIPFFLNLIKIFKKSQKERKESRPERRQWRCVFGHLLENVTRAKWSETERPLTSVNGVQKNPETVNISFLGPLQRWISQAKQLW
jgi:hypothetical protein